MDRGIGGQGGRGRPRARLRVPAQAGWDWIAAQREDRVRPWRFPRWLVFSARDHRSTRDRIVSTKIHGSPPVTPIEVRRLVLALAILLAGCGGVAAPTPAPLPTPTPEPTRSDAEIAAVLSATVDEVYCGSEPKPAWCKAIAKAGKAYAIEVDGTTVFVGSKLPNSAAGKKLATSMCQDLAATHFDEKPTTSASSTSTCSTGPGARSSGSARSRATDPEDRRRPRARSRRSTWPIGFAIGIAKSTRARQRPSRRARSMPRRGWGNIKSERWRSMRLGRPTKAPPR